MVAMKDWMVKERQRRKEHTEGERRVAT